MAWKQRRSPHGFTLVELLIVVAIIAIIAALLLPSFLDALQKAKQKRTMRDMKVAGTAMMSWLSDEVSAAAAGAATTIDISDWTGETDLDAITSALVPTYIQEVPALDGWRHTYSYVLDIADPTAQRVMLVGSGGRDSSTVAGSYSVGSFDPTDYDQDLVWADGQWLRKPDRTD